MNEIIKDFKNINLSYIKKSKSDNWGTPEKILNNYKDWFDPCPYPLPDWNGLEIDWKERNFVNPPYNNIKEWAKKSMDEYKKGKIIHLLIPARTDTKYFHDYILPYAEIEFIKGRLKFISLDKYSENNCAPFSSIMCKYSEL